MSKVSIVESSQNFVWIARSPLSGLPKDLKSKCEEGNLGALEKRQFAVIIGLFFLNKTVICCFSLSRKCLLKMKRESACWDVVDVGQPRHFWTHTK